MQQVAIKKQNEPLWTTAEAAEALGCTRTRIQQLIIAGELPAIRAGARTWLIPDAQIRRLVKAPRRRGGRPRIGDR
jgi:excisionase family DNA binding protein